MLDALQLTITVTKMRSKGIKPSVTTVIEESGMKTGIFGSLVYSKIQKTGYAFSGKAHANRGIFQRKNLNTLMLQYPHSYTDPNPIQNILHNVKKLLEEEVLRRKKTHRPYTYCLLLGKFEVVVEQKVRTP